MASTIFFRINRDKPVDWYVPEDDSSALAQNGTDLEQAAELAHGRKVIVFAAAHDIQIATHMIPVRSRQKILQAVPFTMEEDLIGEPEQFHFAIPARTPDNNIPVCAITRERIEGMLEELKDHRLQPQVMMADCLSLPWDKDQWTVLIEDQESLIRTDQYAGFSFDSDNIELYVQMALQEAGESAPSKIVVLNHSSRDHSQLQQQLSSDKLEIDYSTPAEDAITLLANAWSDECINLLQGDYAARKIRNQAWGKWIPAAAVLMIVLALKAISGAIEFKQLSDENTALEKEIQQTFKQSLPDVKRMVNAKAQMQQRLRQLSGGATTSSGFLPVMARLAPSFQQQKSTVLKGINYREGRLDIDMTIDSLQSLEVLKQAISKKGLNIDIRSAALQGDSVSARLRIKETSQ